MESRTSIHLQVLIVLVHEQYFAIFGVNNGMYCMNKPRTYHRLHLECHFKKSTQFLITQFFKVVRKISDLEHCSDRTFDFKA